MPVDAVIEGVLVFTFVSFLGLWFLWAPDRDREERRRERRQFRALERELGLEPYWFEGEPPPESSEARSEREERERRYLAAAREMGVYANPPARSRYYKTMGAVGSYGQALREYQRYQNREAWRRRESERQRARRVLGKAGFREWER